MNILIVNPIIYTNETSDIKKVNTIKDTMIYDLCLGFMERGHRVTLAAGKDFKPVDNESYPFEVIWLELKMKKLCPPNTLPFCPQVKALAKKGNYDLIISSEIFSLNSLMLAIHSRKNLIIWHELAKHNKIFKGIPSKLWYGIIARLFFRSTLVVPRSIEAKEFISRFCKNVSDEIIDHGVNLEKFTVQTEKENYFTVSSQLIPRKRIDKIISVFAEYLKKYDNTARLCIMGDGEEKTALMELTEKLGIEENVEFTGKLNHSELIGRLGKSRAMLVYTEKDNNMVSIVEAIAVGTPVITTSVPYNASYIRANKLGIVNDSWNENELNEIASNNSYIDNCLAYRDKLSTTSKADLFTEINSKRN